MNYSECKSVKEALSGHRHSFSVYDAERLLSAMRDVIGAKLALCSEGPEKELLTELVDIVYMLGGAAREAASHASAMASSDIHVSRLYR